MSRIDQAELCEGACDGCGAKTVPIVSMALTAQTDVQLCESCVDRLLFRFSHPSAVAIPAAGYKLPDGRVFERTEAGDYRCVVDPTDSGAKS